MAAITARHWRADLDRRRARTAELRVVCSYIAATVPVDEGKEHPLIAEAARITLGEGTETSTVDAAPDVAAPPSVRSDGPADGSYERFMATFGRGLSR